MDWKIKSCEDAIIVIKIYIFLTFGKCLIETQSNVNLRILLFKPRQ